MSEITDTFYIYITKKGNIIVCKNISISLKKKNTDAFTTNKLRTKKNWNIENF